MVPRETKVVRGEASCDAPVPVPGEPVPDGSRILSFEPLVCVADDPCQFFKLMLFYQLILHCGLSI